MKKKKILQIFQILATNLVLELAQLDWKVQHSWVENQVLF